MASDVPALSLNNGQKIPIIGLGTWQASPEGVKNAVRVALDAGYRHIDTAYSYLNEAAIGEVLEEYFTSGKLRREDVFVTSKLWLTHFKKEDVAECLNESLQRLKLNYVDLYLMHFPIALKKKADGSLLPRDEHGHVEFETVDLLETWHALEDLVDEGKILSIGVSNFNSLQIDKICNGARHQPVTNQVECHAYLPQVELEKFCKQRGILITAYSPLGSPGRTPSTWILDSQGTVMVLSEGISQRVGVVALTTITSYLHPFRISPDQPVLMEDPVVMKIATKYKKTPAQILLRNLIQRSIIVIPKSITGSRIEENFKVFDFELSKVDEESLKSIDRKERFFTMKSMVNAPEYPFSEPF